MYNKQHHFPKFAECYRIVKTLINWINSDDSIFNLPVGRHKGRCNEDSE